jgi:hypothetical protein
MADSIVVEMSWSPETVAKHGALLRRYFKAVKRDAMLLDVMGREDRLNMTHTINMEYLSGIAGLALLAQVIRQVPGKVALKQSGKAMAVVTLFRELLRRA